VVYEFVCFDRTACQQAIETELQNRQLNFVQVEENNPNRWFRLKIEGLGWSEVKTLESVRRQYLSSKLRLVWPVTPVKAS